MVCLDAVAPFAQCMVHGSAHPGGSVVGTTKTFAERRSIFHNLIGPVSRESCSPSNFAQYKVSLASSRAAL
jgi:hypothetical protein